MTETDICNIALGKLGHDRPISGDFRTSATTEALRCRLFFDSARRRILASHAWKFAQDKVTLSRGEPCESDQAPVSWYFEMPGDCLNVIRVEDDGRRPVDFDAAGEGVGALICPCQRAVAYYVRDVTNISLWPPLAADALAAELAANLAGPMTGSPEKSAAFRKDASRELAVAQAWNARQFNNSATSANRYLSARGGAGDGRSPHPLSR